ncbi:MAG: 4'-phosphopantetheinyl transferase superfamily protein [Marinilabiliales bacterium]|nr:4'-phosphopantetheinyl transferase superfamily protein [Marinilabiliales bacterium]
MGIEWMENEPGGARIALWQIKESTEELLTGLTLNEKEKEEIDRIKVERRRLEKLATRQLLQAMTGRSEIDYDDDGRPSLPDQKGPLSITHSDGKVAIFIHPLKRTGIDMEPLSRKVGSVANRFLSTAELARCQRDGQPLNDCLLLHWCAKEAVFKMVPEKNIDFASQIECLPPLQLHESGELSAIFRSPGIQQTIPLHYRIHAGMLLVWGSIDPR